MLPQKNKFLKITKRYPPLSGLEAKGDLGGFHQVLRANRSPELHRDAAAASEQTLRISGGGPQDQGPPSRSRSGKANCLAGRGCNLAKHRYPDFRFEISDLFPDLVQSSDYLLSCTCSLAYPLINFHLNYDILRTPCSRTPG
jgi:hypothetical protein